LAALGEPSITRDFIEDSSSYAIFSYTYGADDEEVAVGDGKENRGRCPTW